MLDVLDFAGEQVVDDGNFIPVGEEGVGEIRTDDSASACNKNSLQSLIASSLAFSNNNKQTQIKYMCTTPS